MEKKLRNLFTVFTLWATICTMAACGDTCYTCTKADNSQPAIQECDYTYGSITLLEDRIEGIEMDSTWTCVKD